ncbi:MAG: UDP-N-acetylmuramate--L-alanine ligase [Bacteroidota bacterium]
MKKVAAHNLFFIGIGGIGMSGLAKYYRHLGCEVAGYDRVDSTITDTLNELGCHLMFDEVIEMLPAAFQDKENTLVVYTPAVPKSNAWFQYFSNNGYQMMKRSELLGAVTQDTICLAVAGTHGKTTTSCILAHLLHECEVPFVGFLGGISENFGSNFVLTGTKYSVVEADEFDRSFLRLHPKMACITSMDADHLDIYGSKEALQKAFGEFKALLGSEGKLFIREGLPIAGTTFGFGATSNIRIKNIRVEKGAYRFDWVTPNETYAGVRFNQPGRHNLLNALAALSMALEIGCQPEQLISAVGSYKGVERRFSYQINQPERIFIDDYAHHPTEIDAVYGALMEFYPEEKVTVVFQPHLFSRTQDFADDFARSLAQFDTILLLDIYPAREEPIEGVTSQWLLGKIQNPKKHLVQKEEVVDACKAANNKIVVTLGAGDIGKEVQKIKTELAYAS